MQQNLASAWAATLTRTSVAAAFPVSPARIIPLGNGLPGAAPASGAVGRTLDAYRAMPVRLALRGF